MSNRFNAVFCRAVVVFAALLMAGASARAGTDDPPVFFIESIIVEGASATAARIIVAESRLKEGLSYDEPQLRDAIARIQRLPFVIWTDSRLARGSSVGKYVLVFTVRPMKPFFVDAGLSRQWSYDDVLVEGPEGHEFETILRTLTTHGVVLGGRWFFGANSVVHAAAERVDHRNDRFTLTLSQYDVFDTNVSITAVVSYLDDPGAVETGAPGEVFDWDSTDDLTWELIAAIPIGANDSLRGSWQFGQRPIGFLRLDPRTGLHHRVLEARPQTRGELFWIHDTTDDPLFPTRGTRLTAGGIQTSTPTSSTFTTGRVRRDEMRASLERSFPLAPAHAVTFGGSGHDIDQRLRLYHAFGRYSVDLWGRERTLKYGDLRLGVSLDRTFIRIHDEPVLAESYLRAELVYRNVWGALRLQLAYVGWRTE